MSNTKQAVAKDTAQPTPPTISAAAKILITGVAGAGKTYTLTTLTDAFVVYADTKKRFPLDIPHTNVFPFREFRKIKKVNGKTVVTNNIPDKAIEYNGIQDFTSKIVNKMLIYNKLKGHLPKTVAFDAITNIYKMINDYVTTTTKNVYGSHSADTARDADIFLAWVERELIARGINVVFLAHVIVNRESGDLQVATSGSKTFENTGGFMGVCNYASYVHVNEGARLVANKSNESSTVCRSMLPDVSELEPVEEFNLQNMLEQIREYESQLTNSEI